MGAVAVGALLVSLLLVIVALLLWQEARSEVQGETVYVLDDAAAFVSARLGPSAASRLEVADVRRILEWGIEEHASRVERAEIGLAVVYGSGDAIEALMARSEAELGTTYDPVDIAEVIAAEGEYLAAIGALGAAVEEPET